MNPSDLLVRIHPDCPNNEPIVKPVKHGDAGYDLKVWLDEPLQLSGGETINIRTGVFAKMPDGYWGAIRPRSSTFAKKKLLVMGGTIDEGYTGEISIFVWNPMNQKCLIENGDRLAQLLLMQRSTPPIVVIDSLPITNRGSDGFGSTGT